MNKIHVDKLSVNALTDYQFHFTSLHSLKLRFISLKPSFIQNLFHCISPTLKQLVLAIYSFSNANPTIDILELTVSCHVLLSSLHLLPHLTYFFIIVRSSMKVEFDINKYFKCLTKLEKLIIRQDNYTCRKSRTQQLTSLHLLPNLKHLEWFNTIQNDLEILSSFPNQLQYIHLETKLITNEILYYLSKIPTINSLKSHRYSPIKGKLNIHGFKYLLSLKETLKELEISARDIIYNELTMIQYPLDADCTDDEYEVHLTDEHVSVLKQFIHLKCLSFNRIKITREYLDNLLKSLSCYNNLKILNLEWTCFPSLSVLSMMQSLEELSLTYLHTNNDSEQYADKDFLLLTSLKDLKVLLLYHSIHLSRELRNKLRYQTMKNSKTCHNRLFEKLEAFSCDDCDEVNTSTDSD